ncbi:TPR end-of-group domain-containing protein [Dinghuibacter silviterrae]|uniref:DKNYY family protein n=1 Tax=Dinghuibacter silviterrae TaxID=1539049 RepID=A0A4R8DWJ7_9BACT|nr:DKNYY domain-containing protein [Dinghuibacter silviterrae]TDX01885.1 DKNYY family protein [Dinghuibacter silviterrae]
MSQPVAVFGRLPMGEPSYKDFLKTPEADRLAAFIYAEVDQPVRNFYVFRYLKKEGAVFAFFYFNYGNRESLVQSEPLDVLKGLTRFADPQKEAYIVATLDALNLGKEDNVVAYQIHQGVTKDIPEEDWTALLKDVKKQFFAKTVGDFAGELDRVVDPVIVRKCKALAEEKRKATVAQNLHLASFTEPVHLFENYYYNGRFVYYTYGRVSALDMLDVKNFKQTPYGGTDGVYAVVDGRAVRTDTATFKKMQKGEAIFYKSTTGVYDPQLNRLDNADPASFRLVDENHATDNGHVYFNDLAIEKETLGNFSLFIKGYYWDNIVLQGEKAIYVGKEKIPVDAATWRIVDYHNDPFVLTAEDKDGPMTLYKERPYKEPVQLLRNQQPVKRMTPQPDERYDYFHYVRLNNFLADCFEKKQYREGLDAYEAVQDLAWINPHLFHHAACLYAAMGETDKAVKEVRKAILYGYEETARIWEDEDLKTLKGHEKFEKLHRYHQENPLPVAHTELMEAMLELQEADIKDNLLHTIIVNILNRVYFPEVGETEKYRALLEKVFAAYFTPRYIKEKIYLLYRDHSLLSPEVHNEVFLSVFKDAHFNGRTQKAKLEECLDIAKRAALPGDPYQRLTGTPLV